MIEPVTRWAFSLSGQEPPALLMLGLLGLMTFILGFLNSFIAVPAQTALQERSPEDKRARVFSVFFTVSNLILIVPVFFAGALADLLGYPQTVAMIALVVVLLAGFGLYRMRKSLGSDEPPASGVITREEVESALTAAAPGAQPLPTISQRPKKEADAE
jgi:MFS family permease